MPVETLQPTLRRPVDVRAAATGMSNSNRFLKANRLLQPKAAAAEPRQSAVERLAADKSKYVKSPMALSKQQPVKVPPPVMRKPLMSPTSTVLPTRKAQLPRPNYTRQENTPLDLEHLSNLINGGAETESFPTSSAMDPVESNQVPDNSTPCTSSPCPSPSSAGPADSTVTPCAERYTPVKVGTKAFAKVSPSMSPTAVTIRRVDVIPQHTSAGRTPLRAQPQRRVPLQQMALHPLTQIHNSMSPLRLFHPRTAYTPGGPAPPKPVPALPPQDISPASPSSPFKLSPNTPVFPPSPSATRLSTGSTKKRPSLTRSKSDMSDRYSRAGTDLERFFNLCGLDPSEMQSLKGSRSDIASLAQFRSASAPGSEYAGQEGEEEEEEGGATYGVSIVERNARVIKWLYGIRASKESAKSTNM
ncbi:hypothetical protein UPYG_G00007170 [Umbra pygmaea]|uniref:Family with sequence similarity 110 member A n=1 Tax=Umbra pygmaea TaxID=75934 RepID=A0ABD0XHZ7_UMBPY